MGEDGEVHCVDFWEVSITVLRRKQQNRRVEEISLRVGFLPCIHLPTTATLAVLAPITLMALPNGLKLAERLEVLQA